MDEKEKGDVDYSTSQLLESADIIKDFIAKQNDEDALKSCDIILKSLDVDTEEINFEEKKKIISYLKSTSPMLNSFFLNGEEEKEKTQKRISLMYNIPLSKSNIITTSVAHSFGSILLYSIVFYCILLYLILNLI
jgi:gamma-glutamylcysteine synthetase